MAKSLPSWPNFVRWLRRATDELNQLFLYDVYSVLSKSQLYMCNNAKGKKGPELETNDPEEMDP